MKKFHLSFCGLILFVCFASSFQTLQAQQVPCNQVHWMYLQIKQGVQIPAHCDCMYFVHACTGEPALLPGGQAQIRCGSNPNRCYNISSPFDRICNFPGCELGHELKIIAGNWDVCGKPSPSSCQVYVSQYLPLNPYFNGQLLGLWPGFSSATFPIELNNIHSRTNLQFCPGENALLSFPQLQVPAESGLCLRVNILNELGQIIDFQIFNHSSIMGSDVNVTNLMANLTPGVYQFEFLLTCCNPQEALCTFAATSKFTKRVWFEIKGEFSFSARLTQGGGFSGCPQINVPLNPIPLGPTYQPYSTCGQINMNIFNIVNPENNDVKISVYEIIDCDIEGPEDFQGSIIETPPHGGSVSIPFIPFQQSYPDCKCFRIELEYESCGTINVNSYYYRVNGTVNNCSQNIGGGDETNFLSNPNGEGPKAKVIPNPATNEIYFSLQDEADSYPDYLDLTIMDQSGKVLINTQLNFYGYKSDKISLDLPQGVYIYILKSDELNLNGKFILK